MFKWINVIFENLLTRFSYCSGEKALVNAIGKHANLNSLNEMAHKG